jgi:hypothetical protein
MKRKYLLLGVAAFAATILSACGGSDENAQTAAVPAPQSIDTGQVLELAKITSNNTQPFAVNNGALVIDDTSETSQPISINAM